MSMWLKASIYLIKAGFEFNIQITAKPGFVDAYIQSLGTPEI